MSDIRYYSTNHQAEKVVFHDALLKGLAPDRGLYMPERIPTFTKGEMAAFSQMDYHEIAYEVVNKFLGETIPTEELKKLTSDAYNFEVPLENVYDSKYVMRLDQGPTASFKDFAARLMGRLMQYFLKKDGSQMLILTATSGDTGSAIANAFYGLDNIKVVILFPEGEVTERQRKQMTTLHKNVEIIGLDGKFDDCQALVKDAFNDNELDYLGLSSANSINIGRLIPQSIYYIYAYSRLCKIENGEEIIFSVPSGNFGDLMGGIIAREMGLPVKRFVIATNANNEVPVYFQTGEYKTIVPSKNCISSAMNVGHPSNMARIISLYNGKMNENGEILVEPDIEKLRQDMFATSISDDETRELIKTVYKRHQVILEPHGAVGWGGLCKYLKEYGDSESDNQVCVCLETAHPAKFPAEVMEAIEIDPELPESLKGIEDKEEKMTRIDNNYAAFKKHLKENYK